MKTICWTFVLIALFAVGCATTELPEVTTDHPAHPEAPAGQVSPPSDTLIVTDPVQPPPEPEMGHMQMDEMNGGQGAATPSVNEGDEHKHHDEGDM